MALFWALGGLWAAQPATAAKAPSGKRPDIAAVYFPGFHHDQHYDAWLGEGGNEWRLLAEAPPRFPNHYRLRSAWGEFDEADPQWMARQIDLAADHGINAFVFDWYWYSGVKILHRPLEEGFLQATNRNRLKFALMWANHDWRNLFPAPKDGEQTVWLPSRTSPGDFARLMDYCRANYFGQSNYWRVAGGLYFGIFEAGKFIQRLGGPANARKVLDNARARVGQAGLGAIHFCGFDWAPEAQGAFKEAGLDSVTTYTVTASGKASFPGKPLDLYADVVDYHAVFWQRMDSGVLPYLPVVTVGWDPSARWARDTPWPPHRSDYPYTTLVISNTPAEFGRLCRLARQHVERSPLPPPAILVNAWNEWTEGSALLPEQRFGTGFLEALKEF